MFSCGQAWTQSRQNVQSKLPSLRGWYRCISQPGIAFAAADALFRVTRAHTAGWRTLTSSGETSDCTKLNCPIGHTYLQNAAPLKQLSTTNAATKYPMAIQAVIQGLSHRANAS